MSYPVFHVPAGDVLPVMFTSYAGSTGASVTLTGLAVTDIEIYKDGSTTQRASDAGYTLLGTNGIDFDGITGVHGFSIDTGDNTDAGFYTVGAWFTVVVSAVTIDSQTVSFIACQFRLMAAEGVAGVPDVNTTHVSDTAQTAGDIIGDTNDIQTRLPATLVSGRMDASVGAMAANVMTAAAAAADLTTELQAGLATAAALTTVEGKIDTIDGIVDSILDDTGTAGVVLAANAVSAAAIATGAITATKFAAGAIDAAALSTDAAQEIRDAVNGDTLPELTGDPGATPTVRQAHMLQFMAIRNKRDTDSGLGTDEIHNSAGTVILTATTSDSGTLFTKGKYA